VELSEKILHLGLKPLIKESYILSSKQELAKDKYVDEYDYYDPNIEIEALYSTEYLKNKSIEDLLRMQKEISELHWE